MIFFFSYAITHVCHHCLRVISNIYIEPSLKAELPDYLFILPVWLLKRKGFELSASWCFQLLLNYINFFPFFHTKIHCLTSEFHGKFYAKNRYRMNHLAMSAISVFRVNL